MGFHGGANLPLSSGQAVPGRFVGRRRRLTNPVFAQGSNTTQNLQGTPRAQTQGGAKVSHGQCSKADTP